MKRTIIILLFLMLTAFFCSCSMTVDVTGTDSAEKILSISSNPEKYLKKNIRMAGYYTYEDFSDVRYHYVLLNSKKGQNLGFEIRWSGAYPEPGTAVTVTGTLTSEIVYGQTYIFIEVTDLHVLEPISENT